MKGDRRLPFRGRIAQCECLRFFVSYFYIAEIIRKRIDIQAFGNRGRGRSKGRSLFVLFGLWRLCGCRGLRLSPTGGPIPDCLQIRNASCGEGRRVSRAELRHHSARRASRVSGLRPAASAHRPCGLRWAAVRHAAITRAERRSAAASVDARFSECRATCMELPGAPCPTTTPTHLRFADATIDHGEILSHAWSAC